MSEPLIESQCLPPIPSLQRFFQKKTVWIEVHENYQKRSFRNRFQLAGPNGVERFSIPLAKGKNQGQQISQVQIAYDDDWIRTLSGMFQTNYGSAPFYEHYIQGLMSIFLKEEPLLLDLNMNLLTWVIKVIKVDISIKTTIVYEPNPLNDYQDLRNEITPKSLNSQESTLIYNQVYEEKHGFIPNLSILDMIMCCGPESASLLQSK